MRLERHAEEPPENHMQNQTFHRCGQIVRDDDVGSVGAGIKI